MDIENESKSTFKVRMSFYLYNIGQGILKLHGFFYSVTTKNDDFKKMVLDGEVTNEEVVFDTYYPFVRNSILTNNKQSTRVQLELTNIPKSKRYFAQVLILYSDQDNNLYDTCCRIQLMPNKEKKMEKWGGLFSNQLHSYNRKEKEKILGFLGDHPIAKSIE